MFGSQFIDVTHSENLHWLAVLGSSVVLSLLSSLVPNYVESNLDLRSHNRVRLFNETAARLHIAYIIFLLALITSNDIDKTGNTMILLLALTLVLVFVLFWSIIVSGRTIKRIRTSKNRAGDIHHCKMVFGVCRTPVGWRLGCKVCLTNGIAALAVGAVCVSLTLNPSLIKHSDSRAQNNVTQSQDYLDTIRGTYKQMAHQTKELFEVKVLGILEPKSKDPDLHASYWYRNNETLHQLGTTDQATAANTYKVDEGSIIGCGFFHRNSSVRWDVKNNKRVEVWPYKATRNPIESCKYDELETANITSIVCATYNGSNDKNPEYTVGICVFTTGKVRSVANNDNYHEFLKSKTQEFYESVLPLLKTKSLVPQ